MLHELLLALLGTPSLVLAHASRTYSLARQERARVLCFGVRVRARVRIYKVCFRAHTCVLVSAGACARLFACLRVSARVLRTRARGCVSASALACARAARVLWAWIFVSACATQYVRAILRGRFPRCTHVRWTPRHNVMQSSLIHFPRCILHGAHASLHLWRVSRCTLPAACCMLLVVRCMLYVTSLSAGHAGDLIVATDDGFAVAPGNMSRTIYETQFPACNMQQHASCHVQTSAM
jgi:hypothetical protein